jgi:nucleoid-associated protein YgaU
LTYDIPPLPPRRIPLWERPIVIRLVTGVFAFSLAVCALIVIKPFAERELASVGQAPEVQAETLAALPAAEPAPEPAVTRSATSMDLTAEDLAAARAAMIAYRDSMPQADEMIAAPVAAVVPIASRTASPSTFGINAGPAPAPTHAIQTDATSLGETTAAVLAGLGLETGVPAPEASGDPVRDMTAGALAGIRSATGQQGGPAPRTALQVLVVEALAAGQSDAYIDALLNEAAVAGDITVPAVLVTSDGRVDTAVLLSSLVADARVAAGGAAPAVPDAIGGAGVEVRVVQTATETETYQFYTVGGGDSLGAIAVKFYGDVRHYGLIFEANRDLLSSPDQIQVGQRLVIPELATL